MHGLFSSSISRGTVSRHFYDILGLHLLKSNLVPHPSSLSSLALVQTKRKREGSPPVTRSLRRRCPSQTSSPKVGLSNSSNGALVPYVVSDTSDDEESGSDSDSTSLRMAIQQATGRLRRRDLVGSPSSGSSLNMATQRSLAVSQAPLPSGSSSGGVNQANNSILTSNTHINSSGLGNVKSQVRLVSLLPRPTLVSSPSTSSNDGDHCRREPIQAQAKLSFLPSRRTSTAPIASTSAQPVAQPVTVSFDVNPVLSHMLGAIFI